jgi:hypothetical protein
LNALLPPDHLQDVFSRIFAHLDQQIPALFVDAASTAAFSFPSTNAGKHRLLFEVAHTTKILNGLAGVLPWDFTAINVLERKIDYNLPEAAVKSESLSLERDPIVQSEIEPSTKEAGPKNQPETHPSTNEDEPKNQPEIDPSTNEAKPKNQSEIESSTNEAEPKNEITVVDADEENSLLNVQEQDTPSNEASGSEEALPKSNGCGDTVVGSDTKTTVVVNGDCPSSENEKCLR